jgi:hypothetical protein
MGEEQPDGNWLGYSGQALVATVTRRDENRWDWEVPGAGKPKGWRNSGHRTEELEARRAADAYWDKWLAAAALKPDLGRLAEASAPSKPRKAKAGPTAVSDSRASERRTSVDLTALGAKVEDYNASWNALRLGRARLRSVPRQLRRKPLRRKGQRKSA